MASLLIDFKGNGIIKISNPIWPFMCFIVPRDSVSTSIPDLTTTNGVYFLIDSFQGKRETRKIYVGKTNKGMTRFFDHKGKKDWWDKIFFFTAPSCNFSNDMILGLENYLIEEYKNCSLYEMANSQGSAAEVNDDVIYFGQRIIEVMDFFNYGLLLEDSNDNETKDEKTEIKHLKKSLDTINLFDYLEKEIKQLSASIVSEQAKLYTSFRLGNKGLCAVWVGSKSIEIELYTEKEKIQCDSSDVYDISNRKRGNRKAAIRLYEKKDVAKVLPILKEIMLY